MPSSRNNTGNNSILQLLSRGDILHKNNSSENKTEVKITNRHPEESLLFS